jgi:hypothetical protein
MCVGDDEIFEGMCGEELDLIGFIFFLNNKLPIYSNFAFFDLLMKFFH